MTGLGGVKALRQGNYLKEISKFYFQNDPWLRIFLKNNFFN
jgi:hypothetical protein